MTECILDAVNSGDFETYTYVSNRIGQIKNLKNTAHDALASPPRTKKLHQARAYKFGCCLPSK